ncbi:MAG: TonB-dependent receptor [Ignavibacteriae bacterium]|nr:TonB-dependent receptor [Ignavibacteriota bacterium]
MFGKNQAFYLMVIFLLIITVSNNFSQNSSLRGVVVDSQTKDPLPGANVILVGTSIGSATDIEGKFLIRNISSGQYKLKATYVGYDAKEMSVNLVAGKTIEIEFELKAVSVEGETVVVTAQASGQKEAINQQLSSIQIKNVVSMARIQELPDANAAESVARLPGVSLIREGGEGSKVVIRGLSPQYNQVTIDGVELPGNVVSNDPTEQSSIVGDRATNLSMISSSMLGGIEVIKAITPDMDAAVLGGVVNFGLRKAIKDESGNPTFGLTTQGSYNGLKETYNDYMLVGSYEQRFFDQSFGVFLQGSAEKRNRSSNSLGAGYILEDKTHGDAGIPNINSVNLTDVFSEKERQGATLVLDFAHENGEIGMMNFFSRSDTKSLFRRQDLSLISDDLNYSATDSRNELNIITNLLSIKQEIPIFHVDLKLSHTYSESKNPQDMTFSFWQDNAGLSGLGNLTKLHPQKLASLSVPNSANTAFSGISTSENFTTDRALAAAVDFQTEFIISDYLTAKVKFGGSLQHRNRTYDFNTANGSFLYSGSQAGLDAIFDKYPDLILTSGRIGLENFIDESYDYGNFLGGDYEIAYPLGFDLMYDILDIAAKVPGSKGYEGYKVDLHGSRLYDYHGTENKSAAYVMATFSIGENITILPGVRYQNLTTDYFAYRGKVVSGGIQYTDTTVTKPHGYLLPALHIRYKPLPWLQLHFAYTNTLNYPDFNAIIPRYNIGTSAISYNNYNLKPATSENFDLVLSVYNNEIGLLTFNGFKKKVENLIFASNTYKTDLSDYPDLPQEGNRLFAFSTFINNPIPIDVYGIETDWQTHFWYLPEPFSNIVFNINYTHIFSEASYPKSELINEYNENGELVSTIVDTFYTTRMLNQPNDIMNISIGYDYRGFSGRISMLYQDNIFKSPAFWMQERVNSDKYTRWDLSLKQELPWYGIQLFVNLNNITSEEDVDLNLKNKYPVSRERYGMTGDIGLRINL